MNFHHAIAIKNFLSLYVCAQILSYGWKTPGKCYVYADKDNEIHAQHNLGTSLYYSNIGSTMYIHVAECVHEKSHTTWC